MNKSPVQISQIAVASVLATLLFLPDRAGAPLADRISPATFSRSQTHSTPRSPASDVLSVNQILDGAEERIRAALLWDLQQMKISLEGEAHSQDALKEYEERFGRLIELLLDTGTETSQLNVELQHATEGLLASGYLGERCAGILASAAALQELQSIRSSSVSEQEKTAREKFLAAKLLRQDSNEWIAIAGAARKSVLDSKSVGGILVGIHLQAHLEILGVGLPSYLKVEVDQRMNREIWGRFVQSKVKSDSQSIRYILEPVYIRDTEAARKRSYGGIGVARGNLLSPEGGDSFTALLIRPFQNVTLNETSGGIAPSSEKIPSLIILNRTNYTRAFRSSTLTEVGRGMKDERIFGIEIELEHDLGRRKNTQVFGRLTIDSTSIPSASPKTTLRVLSIGLKQRL